MIAFTAPVVVPDVTPQLVDSPVDWTYEAPLNDVAEPPMLKLVTAVVDVTVNGAVPIATVETKVLAETMPVVSVFVLGLNASPVSTSRAKLPVVALTNTG
jgi:hypothetical protein